MKRLAKKRVALGIPMVGAVASLAFLALFLGVGWAPMAQAQSGVTIGIDADPSQSPPNQPTQLGSIEECFSAVSTPYDDDGDTLVDEDPVDSVDNDSDTLVDEDPAGQTVEVDLYITDVLDLLSFAVYLFHDKAVVNVVRVDVEQFLASVPGSSVFNASSDVPCADLYYVAAAETEAGKEPSGSGVLARVTLQGVGAGISPIWLSEMPEDIVLRPSSGPDIIPNARYHGRMGVDQVDSDADTLADMCDPDEDSDGDTVPNPADADDDDDNYSDQTEAFLGTDPLDDCPNVVGVHDAWPPDNNADTYCNVMDVLNFKPHILTDFMDADYDRRFDMNANQIINILDVLYLKPTIQTQCSNP